MRIQTVLCDLGNVLAPFDFGRCARALGALCGLPAEAVLPKLRGPDFHALEEGRVAPEVFFAELATRLGQPLPLQACLQAWNDIFTLDEAMSRLMHRVAGRYPVYLWSNTSAVHMDFLRPQLPVLERFVDLHLSYELGAIKPDVRFYERAIDRGRLVPERCVFVDDVEANLHTARTLGIHAVLHRSAAETESALLGLGLELG